MTDIPSGQSVEVVLDDLALAKIIAQAAAETPGVVRLQPRPTRVVGRAASNLVQQAASAATGRPVPATRPDPDAVDIEHTPDTLQIVVRLITGCEPAVISIAEQVLANIGQQLEQAGQGPAEIHVQIVDVDPI